MHCCCDQQITLQIPPIYEHDRDSAVYVCVDKHKRALTRNVLKLCNIVLAELGLANWAEWQIPVVCFLWNKPWLHASLLDLVLSPKSAELASSLLIMCNVKNLKQNVSFVMIQL